MIHVQVRLFGKFRKYESDKNTISFSFFDSTDVKTIKSNILNYFSEKNDFFCDYKLIDDSAIADETKILSLDDRIEQSCTLAILPPVCGG